jgi:hypothetical protein
MKRPNVLTRPDFLWVIRPAVIALTALLPALPLLGLNCEMACARNASQAVDTEREPAAGHCATHGDAAPAQPSKPPTPDGCGHHADMAAVKKTLERAQKGLTGLSVDVALPAPAGCISRRSSAGTHVQELGLKPPLVAARTPVLRL